MRRTAGADPVLAAIRPVLSGPILLGVGYATASAGAVAEIVNARYDLPGPVTCALLNRGFNDTYRVAAGAGERFVFRLSGHRARGPADVAAETAFLAHLDATGVPVAAPVPTRDGALFTMAAMPDGPRAAVVFRYADGRPPDLDSPEDARVQGVTLAQIHNASDGFADRAAGRFRLDADHLLHSQVAAVQALDLDAAEPMRDFLALATRLADALGRIDCQVVAYAVPWGYCTG